MFIRRYYLSIINVITQAHILSIICSLRGAAPIHHALLHGRKYTGVSVQTLHPTRFDHGLILGQTALPGIPISPQATPGILEASLSAESSRILEEVILSKAFIPPLAPIVHEPEQVAIITQKGRLVKAPKITKEHSRIDWFGMTANEILRKFRVFGQVWDEELYRLLGGKAVDGRIVYESIKGLDVFLGHAPGTVFRCSGHGEAGSTGIAIATKDGLAIEVADCTIAGKGRKNGAGVRELSKLLVSRASVVDA